LFYKDFLRIHGHFLNSLYHFLNSLQEIIGAFFRGTSRSAPAREIEKSPKIIVFQKWYYLRYQFIKLQNRYFRIVTIRHYKLFGYHLDLGIAGFGNISIDYLIAIAFPS
jgi:hypothetical protein